MRFLKEQPLILNLQNQLVVIVTSIAAFSAFNIGCLLKMKTNPSCINSKNLTIG